MARSKAKTVKEYLVELPVDRREPLEQIRSIVKKNLPKGYVETMNYGMISYEVPLSRYPETYNGQPLGYAALASQKNYLALYLMSAYTDAATARLLVDAFKKEGKKLDMGKSCIRFRTADDLPLEAIGRIIGMTPVERLISTYEQSRRR